MRVFPRVWKRCVMDTPLYRSFITINKGSKPLTPQMFMWTKIKKIKKDLDWQSWLWFDKELRWCLSNWEASHWMVDTRLNRYNRTQLAKDRGPRWKCYWRGKTLHSILMKRFVKVQMMQVIVCSKLIIVFVLRPWKMKEMGEKLCNNFKSLNSSLIESKVNRKLGMQRPW